MIQSLSVFGIFDTRNKAQDAMDALAEEGFVPSEISILFSENVGPQDVMDILPSNLPSIVAARPLGRNLDLMESARSIHVSGLGSFIAAGPAMRGLTHINRSVDGWLCNHLADFGVPNNQAKYYESAIGKGSFLLVTSCLTEDYQKTAEKIFINNGGLHIYLATDSVLPEEEWQSLPPDQFFQPDSLGPN